MFTKIRYNIIYGRVTVKGENGKRVVKLDRNGKASVVIEIFQNPVRLYISTGIKLKPSEWDNKRKEVKGNSSYNDNTSLKRQIAALQDFELRFPALYGRPFSLQDFDLMLHQEMIIRPERQT